VVSPERYFDAEPFHDPWVVPESIAEHVLPNEKALLESSKTSRTDFATVAIRIVDRIFENDAPSSDIIGALALLNASTGRLSARAW
jgi:hypothetical protein